MLCNTLFQVNIPTIWSSSSLQPRVWQHSHQISKPSCYIDTWDENWQQARIEI